MSRIFGHRISGICAFPEDEFDSWQSTEYLAAGYLARYPSGYQIAQYPAGYLAQCIGRILNLISGRIPIIWQPDIWPDIRPDTE